MKLYFWQCMLLLTAALTGIIGCAGKPIESLRPPPQTRIEVHFQAVADLNPDLSNRASPLIVRLYELKAPGAFTSADFFSLYTKADEVLATELLNQEELVIKPGGKRSLERNLNSETRYIGLLAAYRKLDSSEWRTVIKITPQATTSIRVNLGRTDMSARPSAG